MRPETKAYLTALNNLIVAKRIKQDYRSLMIDPVSADQGVRDAEASIATATEAMMDARIKEFFSADGK